MLSASQIDFSMVVWYYLLVFLACTYSLNTSLVGNSKIICKAAWIIRTIKSQALWVRLKTYKHQKLEGLKYVCKVPTKGKEP